MEWVTLHQKCYERFEERMQAMHRYLATHPVNFDGLAVKQYVLRLAQDILTRYQEAIDKEDLTACVVLRRGLESYCLFLIIISPQSISQQAAQGKRYAARHHSTAYQ